MNKWTTLGVAAQVNLHKDENGDEYYRIKSIRQLDSNNFCFSIELEKVAYRFPLEDTVYEAAYGNRDGDYITFYPLHENLRDLLEDEGYRIMSDNEAEMMVLDYEGGTLIPLREVC